MTKVRFSIGLAAAILATNAASVTAATTSTAKSTSSTGNAVAAPTYARLRKSLQINSQVTLETVRADPASYAGRALEFSAIVTGTVTSVMVAEDDDTYAFMDIDPGSDGHLLVVPRRHSTDLFDISAHDLTATSLAVQRIAKVAVTEFGADGMNLFYCSGMGAWQTVFHFHLHLIPRYADKTKDRLTLLYEPGGPADPDKMTALGHRLATALTNSRSAN